MATGKDDDIDYTAKGATPPHEKDDPKDPAGAREFADLREILRRLRGF